MPKKRKRSTTRNKKQLPLLKKIWSSLLHGGGEIYVIFILATIITGSFALTGGVTPEFNQNPPASDNVEIDTSARQSNTQSLQLIDLKAKPTATPTFIPTGIPTDPTRVLSPTPPDACLNRTAIALVLDVSTSMNADGKFGQLNNALTSLVGQLQNDTVIGAVEFAGLASFPNTSGANTLLPFTRYRDNRTLVQSRLRNLSAHTSSLNDGTYFRSAFSRTISNINAVKSTYESQGYKFVTVVFTDGVPETQFTDRDCLIEVNNPYVCFANKQDPRTDLTGSLKNISSRVYSIGIFSGQRERAVLSQARQLLADIASGSSYTSNSDDPRVLTTLFQNMLTSVCK